MTSKLQLCFRDAHRWGSRGGTHARGAAFVGDQLYRGEELAVLLQHVSSWEEWHRMLGGLNGFFAVMHAPEHGTIWAATDRVRSIPLFYGQSSEGVYLSDDAYWVAAQVGDTGFDELAQTEFELTGYVTGRDTLLPRVKQLQAGETLAVSLRGGAVHLVREFYNRPFHRPATRLSEAELTEMLDEALSAAVKRLMAYAGGRRIAIPLSAGVDARQIAAKLTELGYTNLLAYTYGRPRGHEVRLSSAVASALSIPWEFIHYTEARWRGWFESRGRERFYRQADNLCSLPVLQEWPAVGELARREAVPPDAVFVPGYTAEAMHGAEARRMDWPAICEERLDIDDVVEGVLDEHYALWDWSARRAELKPRLKERVLAVLADGAGDGCSAGQYRAWCARERQAKFILNTVRTYEYWGLDWWVPLLDNAIADFWGQVPIKYFLGLRLARTYSRLLYERVAGACDKPSVSTLGLAALHRGAAAVRSLGRRVPSVLAGYHVLQRNLKYGSHPLAWYGMIPPKLFKRLFFPGISINSFLVLERLGRISFDHER